MKKISIIMIVFSMLFLMCFGACDKADGKQITIGGLIGNPSVSEAQFKIGYNDSDAYVALNEAQQKALTTLLTAKVDKEMNAFEATPTPGKHQNSVNIKFANSEVIFVAEEFINIVSKTSLTDKTSGNFSFAEKFDYENFVKAFTK